MTTFPRMLFLFFRGLYIDGITTIANSILYHLSQHEKNGWCCFCFGFLQHPIAICLISIQISLCTSTEYSRYPVCLWCRIERYQGVNTVHAKVIFEHLPLLYCPFALVRQHKIQNAVKDSLVCGSKQNLSLLRLTRRVCDYYDVFHIFIQSLPVCLVTFGNIYHSSFL